MVETCRPVGDEFWRNSFTPRINTFVETTPKELNPENAEDEPKHHAHKNYVGDARDCFDKTVDYHLKFEETIMNPRVIRDE